MNELYYWKNKAVKSNYIKDIIFYQLIIFLKLVVRWRSIDIQTMVLISAVILMQGTQAFIVFYICSFINISILRFRSEISFSQCCQPSHLILKIVCKHVTALKSAVVH